MDFFLPCKSTGTILCCCKMSSLRKLFCSQYGTYVHPTAWSEFCSSSIPSSFIYHGCEILCSSSPLGVSRKNSERLPYQCTWSVRQDLLKFELLIIPPQTKFQGYTEFTLSVYPPVYYFLSSFQYCYKTLLMCILPGNYVVTNTVNMNYVRIRCFSANLCLMCWPQLLNNDFQDCSETQWNVRLPYEDVHIARNLYLGNGVQ